MSYTAAFASACCQVKGLDSTRSAAMAVYDYLVNHPDEIPDSLSDDDNAIDEIEAYIELNNENVIISYSTENDGNYSSEIFDFLAKHFACLQTSFFMEVSWIVDDSRSGYSSGTDYYDRTGALIDVRSILTSYFLQKT